MMDIFGNSAEQFKTMWVGILARVVESTEPVDKSRIGIVDCYS